MSTRSGQEFHEYHGIFATRADLPNVAGSSTQKVSVEIGDYAWVTDEMCPFRCLVATVGAAVWVQEPWSDARRGVPPLREDWISTTPAGQLGWSTATIGGGSSAQIANALADASHDGIVELDTGATATGLCALYLGVDGIVTPAAGGVIVAEAAVQFPTLSTAAQEYISRLLLGDSLLAADHTDGIYFEYNRAFTGNFWVCKAANGVPPGNRAIAITTVPVAAGVWYRLRVIITPTSAIFYIDDTLVATLLANIPAGSAQRYAPNLKIQKTAGVLTASNVLIDYFQMRLVTAATR